MIKVLFFAQLREQLNCADLDLMDSDLHRLQDVKARLIELYPHWESFLSRPNLLMAVNQQYAKAEARVSSGDEVAFFPPVTGG